MRYETSYVIVAGIAWIRCSHIEFADGHSEDRAWVVTFAGDVPDVRTAEGKCSPVQGTLGDLTWSLALEELAPTIVAPHRLLRRLSPTRLTTGPAALISGRIGSLEFERAPGHYAVHRGQKHAQSWGWAHASSLNGDWATLLTAVVPPLPRMSVAGNSKRPPGLPLHRGSVAADPPLVRVGRYRAEAPADSFFGLEYRDTDGTSLWCYHSEHARLSGPKLSVEGAAMEIAVREPIPGWSILA